jgi:hypothetical protein
MHNEIIRTHREDILVRCLVQASTRSRAGASLSALEYGLRLLLDDLAEALCGPVPRFPNTGHDSARRGGDLFGMGFTISQVVGSYGDIRQATRAIANELGLRIATEDDGIFNRCLDAAIASAVTEYERLAAAVLRREVDDGLGLLVHELRNSLTVALLAFDTLQHNGVDLSSRPGRLLRRGLLRLRRTIDQSDMRIVSGVLSRSWAVDSGSEVASAPP